MTILAAICFFSSLLGLVLLFTLKYAELSRDVVYAPDLRKRADERAVQMKEWMLLHTNIFEFVSTKGLELLRLGIHTFAVWFAGIARKAEVTAHIVADAVSQKRTFKERETQSDYLRHMSEFKSEKEKPDFS